MYQLGLSLCIESIFPVRLKHAVLRKKRLLMSKPVAQLESTPRHQLILRGGEVPECRRKYHGCQAGEVPRGGGKVAKVTSLFKSLLSPAKEKIPDLNDREAVFSYINEMTKDPLSRKLLLEYASDEVRAGIVQCSGHYSFHVRILELQEDSNGYFRLAETDPDMYRLLSKSERVPLDVRDILQAVQNTIRLDPSLHALMIKVIVVPKWPADLNEKYEEPLLAGAKASGLDDVGAVGGCKALGEYDIEGPYEDKLQLAITESLRPKSRGL